jgi:hypothetical protein
MKACWCLAASDAEASAAELVNHYACRWTIEPQFRDTKDLRFGMGLSSTRIGEPTRRDRLLVSLLREVLAGSSLASIRRLAHSAITQFPP